MPPAPPPSDHPVRVGRSRGRPPGLRLLLPLVVVLAALAACGGDDDAPTAYGAGTEAEFMELCVPGGGSGATSTTVANDASSTVAACQCAYDSVVEEIPFERYADELRGALLDGPSSWPDEITELMTDCVLAGLDLDATSTTAVG